MQVKPRVKPDVKVLEKRLFFMKEQQEKLVPVWREISEYVAPNRGAFDLDEPNLGHKRDRKMVNPTPSRALGILQAGMQGGLTSPSRAWFKLQVSDPALGAVPSVMYWLDDVTERLQGVFSRSNIYDCLHGLYGEIAAFGIGALLIDDADDGVVHGKLMTAGEYFVSFDAADRPDAFGRILWMTAGQMAQAFGEENLSEPVKRALADHRPTDWFKACHLICEDSARVTGRPYMGLYWEQGKEAELLAGGYDEFPVVVPRWETISGSYYGYSPGWLALSESKTLQVMQKDYLMALQMSIDPPVVAPAAARNQGLQLFPGGQNYSPDGVDAAFRPLYQVNPDLGGQLQAIELSEQKINQIFYSDLFMMIASVDPGKMTATEAQIRQQEKTQMLGPVIDRMNHELFDPTVTRTFNIMNRRGMIPPPPEELAGQDIKIEYVSLLALAQRAGGLSEIGNLLMLMGQIAQMAPDVTDKLNADEAIDQYVKYGNLPAVLVRSDDEVAALRNARAQQQQQAQQMAAVQQMAATAKQGAGAMKDLEAAPNLREEIMREM